MFRFAASTIRRLDKALQRSYVSWAYKPIEVFRAEGAATIAIKFRNRVAHVASFELDHQASDVFTNLISDLASGRYGPIAEK